MYKKNNYSWVEMLFRVKPFTTISEIEDTDFRMAGGAIPDSEINFSSDVFAMFREIPYGMEKWFDRPLRSLDVLLQCYYRRSTSMVRAVPLLIASLEDCRNLGFAELQQQWQPIPSAEDHIALRLPGVWKPRMSTIIS